RALVRGWGWGCCEPGTARAPVAVSRCARPHPFPEQEAEFSGTIPENSLGTAAPALLPHFDNFIRQPIAGLLHPKRRAIPGHQDQLRRTRVADGAIGQKPNRRQIRMNQRDPGTLTML